MFVDKDSDANFLEVTARRIAWGRFSNAGQTCIAPDYVLTHRSMMKPLTVQLQKALLEYYGADAQKSDSYARIVNAARFRTLTNLLKGQEKRIVIGGQSDEKDLYIAPTVLEDVSRTDAVMQEEIFGPILPMVAVDDIADAIRFVNSGDKPLALYVFSRDKGVCKEFIDNTTSGGAVSNDVLMHCTGIVSRLCSCAGLAEHRDLPLNCHFLHVSLIFFLFPSSSRAPVWRRRRVGHGCVPRQAVI